MPIHAIEPVTGKIIECTPTAGAIISTGDIVRYVAGAGTVEPLAAAATNPVLGVATSSCTAAEATAGKTVMVRVFKGDESLLMDLENAYGIAQNGLRYALVGGTGAQLVDNNKTDADVFQVEGPDANSSLRAWVRVIVLGEAT